MTRLYALQSRALQRSLQLQSCASAIVKRPFQSMFSKLVAAAILCVPFIGQGVLAQEPNCARNYTVQVGDICDSISAAQNVSTFQLAFVNSDKIDAACDNLQAGESLCLGVTGQDCDIVHVVASTDGCDTISAGAGIPQSTLLQNNPNVNTGCTNIYPGEVLCTDSTIFNYTSTTTS